MQGSWGIVVPLKPLGQAKTRLAAYGDAVRRQLALAFAVDVVSAAVASPLVSLVLVVTDDAAAADRLEGCGAQVVPDEPRDGLNAALRHGAALLADQPLLGIAALAADLPALRSGDLDVLGQVGPGDRGFVSDTAGVGTTLLAAALPARLEPLFGSGSRDAHLAGGAVELAAGARLHRDVDTPEDLRAALGLGVGPATRQVAGRLPLALPGDVRRRPRPEPGPSS